MKLLKDVFYLGVGTLALGYEKTSELINEMVKRGELTHKEGEELTKLALSSLKANYPTLKEEVMELPIFENLVTKDEFEALKQEVKALKALMKDEA